MASQAALDGPSGFSLALISTAPGGGALGLWPCRAMPEGGAAPVWGELVWAAWARWASVRIGVAAARAAALRNDRRPMASLSDFCVSIVIPILKPVRVDPSPDWTGAAQAQRLWR